MAENEDGQEKTEQPTGKRLDDARQKGQVPRSRELNTTVVLMASAGGLLMLGGTMGGRLVRIMDRGLAFGRSSAFDPAAPTRILGDVFFDMLALLTPFLLLTLVAVLATPMMLGGWSFSSKALALNLSKLDPVKGMSKIVSPNGLMELAKSVVKIALVAGVATLLITHMFGDLAGLGELSAKGAIWRSFGMVGWFLLSLSSVLILIAAVDVPFQTWNHRRQLRMTKKEVKDESKETEGNPEIKSRIRRVQQEMAMSRMMAEIPQADVVVTNPTHFAVALRYAEDSMKAPRVVAKGADLIAAQIRNVARENQVPMFAAPPLARALYHNTELNQEIPAGLYLAVAQVLAYVYQLKISIHGDVHRPEPPTDLSVPDEFIDG